MKKYKLESPWYKVFYGIKVNYIISIFGKDIIESIYRSHCNSFVAGNSEIENQCYHICFVAILLQFGGYMYDVTTIKHSTGDKQTTTSSFNSTCNLFLLISATISFLYWKLVILLIRYHLPLVYILVPSLGFAVNTILTFLNHLVVVLPSFLHSIFIMAYVSSVLERLKMLSRLLKLFKILPMSLSLPRLLVNT